MRFKAGKHHTLYSILFHVVLLVLIIVSVGQREGPTENDGMQMRGQLLVEHYGSDGQLKDQEFFNNLVVNQGLEYAAKSIANLTAYPFSYIQIGSSDTLTVSSTQTYTMHDEDHVTPSYVADYTIRWDVTYTGFSSSPTIRSAGIFDNPIASAPHMLCGKTFSDKDMESGDTLRIIWDLIFGR